MKKAILLTLMVLASTSLFGREWMFELNPNQIRMCSGIKLKRPSYFVDSCKTRNMINLSFFNSNTFIGPYKDNSTAVYTPYKMWPVFVVENGEAHIYDGRSWEQFVTMNLNHDRLNYIVSGYPLLLQAGEKTQIRKSFFSKRRCPRTALGIHPNGSVIVYVTTNATLREVQDYFTMIGCTDAINLDGGSSTFLYLNGEKVFSSNQGRSYPNVLYWE